jgi:hypothetical protein
VFALEGMVLVFAVALVCLAVYTHRKLKPAEEAPAPEPEDGGSREKA